MVEILFLAEGYDRELLYVMILVNLNSVVVELFVPKSTVFKFAGLALEFSNLFLQAFQQGCNTFLLATYLEIINMG